MINPISIPIQNGGVSKTSLREVVSFPGSGHPVQSCPPNWQIDAMFV